MGDLFKDDSKDVLFDEYDFKPKIIDDGVIDYSKVEADKIYLVNKKDILEKKKPSWIPDFDSEYLIHNKFIPTCVKGADGYYYVLNQKKDPEEQSVLVGRKQFRTTIYNDTCIYRMSLEVLSASIDYYLKREKALKQQRFQFPKSDNRMSWIRLNGIIPLLMKYNPSLDKELSEQKFTAYNPTSRQKNIAFKEWKDVLELIKDKKLDMSLQKADLASTYEKGEETSYGESNCNDSLKDKYGIRYKKQNGKGFNSDEKELLDAVIGNVWNYYGSNKLSSLAKDYGLKVSYADNCNQHAKQKWIGIFTPYFKAVGVSFFGNAHNLLKSMQSRTAANRMVPDCILSHEIAHWLDNRKGAELHHWYASDQLGTAENRIASIYKRQLKSIVNTSDYWSKYVSGEKVKLSNYWYRTCECFARAIEQDYAMKNNITINDAGYLPENIYREKIQPLVEDYLMENKTYFDDIENVNIKEVQKMEENKIKSIEEIKEKEMEMNSIQQDFDFGEEKKNSSGNNMSKNKDNRYRYYLIKRPMSIGTQPNGFIGSFNYSHADSPESYKDAGFSCYGWVEYDHPLTEKEISDYELKESILEKPLRQKEIALQDKSTGKVITITDSDNYGYQATIYDKDYKKLDGWFAYDYDTSEMNDKEAEINDSEIAMWNDMPFSEAVETILEELGFDINNMQELHYEEIQNKIDEVNSIHPLDIKVDITDDYDESQVKEKLVLMRTITNNAGTNIGIWEDLGHLINRSSTEAFKELCKKVSKFDIKSCFPDYDGDIFAEERNGFNTLWYNKDFEEYLKTKDPEGKNSRLGLALFADNINKFWEENDVSAAYSDIHKKEREPLDNLSNEELVDLYKENPSNYEILSRICEELEAMQMRERDVPLQYRPYEQVKCITDKEKILDALHKSYEDTYSKKFRKEEFLKQINSNKQKSVSEIFRDIAHEGAVRTHNNKSLQDMRDFIEEEIKKREDFSGLDKKDKEELLEKHLLEGHGIYVSVPGDLYITEKGMAYRNLRIISEKRRFYVLGNTSSLPKKNKINELKVSKEINAAIKSHTVLEVLEKYNFTPYSYESDMEVKERLLNDSFDQTVYAGLLDFARNGHLSPDKANFYLNKIDALVDKDLTFREVCAILNHSQGTDDSGRSFIQRLGTQQNDIINDIIYLIGKKHEGVYSRTNNSNDLKLYESAFRRIKPKLFIYKQNVKEYEYNNKKYEIVDATVYSQGSISDDDGLFESNIMFIAKEYGAKEYNLFEGKTGEMISPNKISFKTLEEAKDYILFEKHPNKSGVIWDWFPRKTIWSTKYRPCHPDEYSKIANNTSLLLEAAKHDLISDKSNFFIADFDSENFYFNSDQVEIVNESLKKGKLLNYKSLAEYKRKIVEEIKKNSLIIEGTLDIRRQYRDNSMKAERTFVSEDYIQKIRAYGYDFPVVVYEGNEGYENKYPELISNKVYELGEFEHIMSKIDAENATKLFRGYDKSYFIVIDEDGEVHDERYDIGDRLGGFVRGLHHEWDFVENKLKENPKFSSYYETREEAEIRHSGQAAWIKTLDEAVEKWEKKHLTQNENPIEKDAKELEFKSATRGISSINFDTEKMTKEELKKLTGITVRDEDVDKVMLTAHYYYDKEKSFAEHDEKNIMQDRDGLIFALSVTEFKNDIGRRAYLLEGQEYFYDGNNETPIKAGIICEEKATDFLRKTEGSMYTIRNYIGSKGYLLDNSVIPIANGVYPNKSEEKMQSFDENELSYESMQTIINKSELVNKMFIPERQYLEDIERLKRFYDEYKNNVSSAVDVNLAQFVRDWGVRIGGSKVPELDDISQLYESSRGLYKELVKVSKNGDSLSIDDLKATKVLCTKYLKSRCVQKSPCLVYSPSIVLDEFIKSKEISKSGLTVSDLRSVEKDISFNLFNQNPNVTDTVIIDTLRSSLENIINNDTSDRNIVVTDNVIKAILDFEKNFNKLTEGWNETAFGYGADDLIQDALYKDYPDIWKEVMKDHSGKLYKTAFEYAYYKDIQDKYYSDSNRGFFGMLNLKAEFQVAAGNLEYPVVAVRYSDSPSFKSGSVMSLKDFDALVKKDDDYQIKQKETDSIYLKNIDVNIITEDRTYRWDSVIGDGNGGFKDRIQVHSDWENSPNKETVTSFVNLLEDAEKPSQKIDKFQSVKDWYVSEYFDDELGHKLDSSVSFNDVEDLLNHAKGKQLYELLGVDDSVVRERLFNKLAELNGLDYSAVYNRWLDEGILPYKLSETKEYEDSQKFSLKEESNLSLRTAEDASFKYYGISETENKDLRRKVIDLYVDNPDLYKEPIDSPWGSVDNVYYPVSVILDDGNAVTLPGVFEVSTAGHGGWMIQEDVGDIILSKKARKGHLENGFYVYEEDCDHSIVEFELIHNGFIIPKNKTDYGRIIESLEYYNPEYLYNHYADYFDIPENKTMEAKVFHHNYEDDPKKFTSMIEYVNGLNDFKDNGINITDGFMYGENKKFVLLIDIPGGSDKPFGKESLDVYKIIKKQLREVGIYLRDYPVYNPFSSERIIKNVSGYDNVVTLSSLFQTIENKRKIIEENREEPLENVQEASGLRIGAITGFSGKKLFVGLSLSDELIKDESVRKNLMEDLSNNGFYKVEYLDKTGSLQISIDCERSDNSFLKNIDIDKMPDLLADTEKEVSSRFLQFCVKSELFESVQNILDSKDIKYDLFWNNEEGKNVFHLVSKNEEMKRLLEAYSSEEEQKKAMNLYDGLGNRSYCNEELLPTRFNVEDTAYGLVLNINESISVKEEDRLLLNGICFDIHDRQFYIKDIEKFTAYMKKTYPDDFIKIDNDLKNISETKEISKKNGTYKLPESIDNTADKFFENIKELALTDPSFKNNLKKIASVLMKNSAQEEKIKMLALLGDDLEGLDKKLYESVWGNKKRQEVKKNMQKEITKEEPGMEGRV